MTSKSKLINAKLYKKLQKLLPIACVDIVINTPKGLILGVRKNEPMKGKLWLPGGRVNFGESLEAAAKRKALQETGIGIKITDFIGVYNAIFYKGEVRHNIAVVYLAVPKSGKLKTDQQHSKFFYVRRNEKFLDPYIRRVIDDSGVFKAKGKFMPQNFIYK